MSIIFCVAKKTPSLPLNTCQDRCHIVRWAPTILQDIQAQFPSSIDVGMEHCADKLDCGRLVRILLLEMHDQSKGSIFEWGICWADDHSVPLGGISRIRQANMRRASYQVITLSATGDADTPAGGSVCIRFEGRIKLARRSSVLCMAQTNLEVAHQSASSGCRHDVGISLFDGGESGVGNSEARYCRGSWCWLSGGGEVETC